MTVRGARLRGEPLELHGRTVWPAGARVLVVLTTGATYRGMLLEARFHRGDVSLWTDEGETVELDRSVIAGVRRAPSYF